MTIGYGGLILVLILWIVGFIAGFAMGIKYLFDKIKRVCGYEMFKEVLDKLHSEANESKSS